MKKKLKTVTCETSPMADTTLVALDLGSNSFHMVIARIVEGNLQLLSRHKEKVRQGAGLSATLQLDEAAMQRGLDSLARFNERLQPFAHTQVRVVGTHTLRQATNARQFIERAAQVLAHPIEVISGHEEARLIFQAVAHCDSTQENTLVLDIGGGSTELIIGRHFKVKRLTSRTMGCVSFTQRYFAQGLTQAAFAGATLAAKSELEPIVQSFKKTGWQRVFATSGTAKALATCAKALGFESITPASLQALQQQLIASQGALAIKGINPERMQVLAAGLAIMQAMMQDLAIECAHYSKAALREGVLYEMHGDPQHKDIQLRTHQSLQLRYQVDLNQAERVSQTAQWLWQQLQQPWQLPAHSANLLAHAAGLSEVGLNIHSSSYHRHSAYILEHTDLPGFNQDEQLVLANLVRFHRKRLQLAQLLPIEYLMKEKLLLRLIRILRLAILLNVGRHRATLPQLASAQGKQMTLQFAASSLTEQQLLQADLERECRLLASLDYQLVIVTT